MLAGTSGRTENAAGSSSESGETTDPKTRSQELAKEMSEV
jgi:hypothetical protein